MIIVDPVTLGDAACTRPSLKWVWDRTATLVEVPPDTLGVTYDPTDLSKAPYADVDAKSKTNFIRNNTMQGAVAGTPGMLPNFWERNAPETMSSAVVGVGQQSGVDYVDLAVAGTAAGQFLLNFDSLSLTAAASGEAWATSVFCALASGSTTNIRRVRLRLREGRADGSYVAETLTDFDPTPGVLSAKRFSTVKEGLAETSERVGAQLIIDATGAFSITLRIGMPQLETDKVTSPMKSEGAAFTRAADMISSIAGLVYSNVPMVEPPYSATMTYAKDSAVHDPATKIVYWSMQAANVGQPLSDPAWWNKRTAINRWAMFDDRNSTVTSNPEEIIAVVSARAITQGLFAGALDASEVLVSMTHPTRGVVYSEKRNLVLPRPGSSFFGWCFNRLRMRTWFLTLKLPVFANALVTITIRRPGGVAKCGMCMIGPAIDVGLSLMGLSTELKDYSTTTFYPDGSSDTIPRGFSKRMSIDLSVERDRVETIEDDLIKRRQKTLVWLGSTMRGDTMLVGKFSSFRKVIDSYPRSKMALQIEGVLSQ